jgi:hypothetical protein
LTCIYTDVPSFKLEFETQILIQNMNLIMINYSKS